VNLIVIGGGLVGMATALQLARTRPALTLRLLEKEPRVGAHQSTHNSGVLHAGLYYKPGSLKARLAVSGIRQMVAFCREHGVRHEICGKIVVATEDAEIPRLQTMLQRGAQNGLQGLRWLSTEELREIEPHAGGLAAVSVPEEGIVDYAGVCEAMRRELAQLGVEVTTSARVVGLRQAGGGWRVSSTAGDWEARYIVNCAGLYCDRIAALAGIPRETRIVPFRGEYYGLKPQARHLVRHLIYPVPDPVFPFLGVHFTRLIDGGVEAGPNAVLALAREGYGKWKVNPGDLFDALSYKGLWRFIRQHKRMVWNETRRSLSKRLFCAALQKLVPAIQESDLADGGSGVRAQAMLADGTLVQDFSIIEGKNALHVLNAPSPAATASLAIGEYITQRCLEMMGPGREGLARPQAEAEHPY
jgi:L-2-hydroxyglutarate oxidase